MEALVHTTWSFPITTTCAASTASCPTGAPAENQSSVLRADSIAVGPGTPSITQTPTSAGVRTIDASWKPSSTKTVIPSAIGVACAGTTRSPDPIAIPSESSSSPTLELTVRTASGRPSTTSVTLFWIAR